MTKHLSKYLFLFVLSVSLHSEHILIKIPTRQRPQNFFSCLDSFIEKASGSHKLTFLVSCDNDDLSMNNSLVKNRLQAYENVHVYFSPRKNKVEAINRDLDKHLNFDLLIVASDDMLPAVRNYDSILVDCMKEKFPDTDGVINFYDGHIGNQLNTIPVIGKKYYDRFQYIYFPKYQSVFCDLELTIVSKMLKRELYINQKIIQHNHPAYGYPTDDLYKLNESPKLAKADKEILIARKAANFGYEQKAIGYDKLPTTLDIYNQSIPNHIRWSILICTVDTRQNQFLALYKNLIHQITESRLHNEVEVIFFKDNCIEKVGLKRNKLLQSARGDYVCFIDDDDRVCNDYVPYLHSLLRTNPDCLSLIGIFSEPGARTRKFYHSIRYKKYINMGSKLYRPPNHLNVIKSSIAKQFEFPTMNCDEDYNWAMKICNSGILKNEVKVKKPIYFYDFDSNKTLTQRK